MARPGLTRHKKFARLARLIGSEALARGHLELIWDVAYENGDADVGDAGDVEFLARWQGESGKLASAMVASGFLDLDGDRHTVHDLWDHAPDYVRKRQSREAQRRTKGAVLEAESRQCPVADRSESGQCPPNGRTRAPAPAPTPKEEEKTSADAAPSASRPTTPVLVQDHVQGQDEKPRDPKPPRKPSFALAFIEKLEGERKASIPDALPDPIKPQRANAMLAPDTALGKAVRERGEAAFLDAFRRFTVDGYWRAKGCPVGAFLSDGQWPKYLAQAPPPANGNGCRRLTPEELNPESLYPPDIPTRSPHA